MKIGLTEARIQVRNTFPVKSGKSRELLVPRPPKILIALLLTQFFFSLSPRRSCLAGDMIVTCQRARPGTHDTFQIILPHLLLTALGEKELGAENGIEEHLGISRNAQAVSG